MATHIIREVLMSKFKNSYKSIRENLIENTQNHEAMSFTGVQQMPNKYIINLMVIRKYKLKTKIRDHFN